MRVCAAKSLSCARRSSPLRSATSQRRGILTHAALRSEADTFLRVHLLQQSLIGRDMGATLCQTSPSPEVAAAGNGDGDADPNLSGHLSIIVLGASGDLAVKKTYPALFALFRHGLLPKVFTIVGYARSEIEINDFKAKISKKFPTDAKSASLKDEFLRNCWYVQGQYDSEESFHKLHVKLFEHETKALGVKLLDALKPEKKLKDVNRIFYMSVHTQRSRCDAAERAQRNSATMLTRARSSRLFRRVRKGDSSWRVCAFCSFDQVCRPDEIWMEPHRCGEAVRTRQCHVGGAWKRTRSTLHGGWYEQH